MGTKKKFANLYRPAWIVKGSQRWQLKWYQYNPATDKLEMCRETFGINRIKDIKEREKRAIQIKSELNNNLLPSGYPFVQEYLKKSKSLKESFSTLREIIAGFDRYQTRKTFGSAMNQIEAFANEKEIMEMKIIEFDLNVAIRFFDWKLSKGIGNNTYNSLRGSLITLFNYLVERNIMEVNPFQKTKRKKKTTKLRRFIKKHERDAIAKYIKENDYWMWRALLLQYYCHIRTTEMRRLRFSYFDFKLGLIIIPGEDTKNRQVNIKTIPNSILKFFTDPSFSKQPGNYYVFGVGGQPHANKKIGLNTMWRRHNAVLEILKIRGELSDITGIQWYSWKDTGMTDLKKYVGIDAVRKQADHSTEAVTRLYMHDNKVNAEYRRVPFNL